VSLFTLCILPAPVVAEPDLSTSSPHLHRLDSAASAACGVTSRQRSRVELAKAVARVAAPPLAVDPSTTLERREGGALAERLLAALGERTCFVVRRRLDLDGEGGATLDQLAGLLGVTRERVRQIELQGLHRLRAGLTPRRR
jgi:hypothetical protein